MSNAHPTAYRLGRLRFTLSGEGPCVGYLHEEFSALRQGGDASVAVMTDGAAHYAPHMMVDFVEKLPPMAGYSASRPVNALDDEYRVSYRGMNYHVSQLAEAAHHPTHSRPLAHRESGAHPRTAIRPIHVSLRLGGASRRGRVSVALQRVRNPGFLSVDERNARAFMYDVFDHLSQVAQLPLGQSYIHASSVERDGEGIAIIAWSGVGKTAALVKLITEHGFRFLSDDVALVDDSATLWRTPKLIQLKGINVAGEPRLRSMLLDGRSALDRFSWTQRRWRHGELGVRRRVSAERFFGPGAVTRSAPLRRIYCLERAEVSDFDVQEISTAEICRRASEMMTGILEPFPYLSRAIHSGHYTPILPTRTRMREETAAVLRRAFDSVPVFNVRVPLAATPASLSTYLVQLLEGARSRRRAHVVSAEGG